MENVGEDERDCNRRDCIESLDSGFNPTPAGNAHFPGDFGNLPLLGFGLWKWPIASLILEAVIIGLGAILYFRSPLSRSKKTSSINKKGLRIAILAGSVMGVLLILSLITDNLK